MKCPFQTVSITETIKAYAIASAFDDFVRTTVFFQECLKDECPYYRNDTCQKVLKEGEKK